MKAWVWQEIPNLRGFAVEWAEPGRVLFSRHSSIYKAIDLDEPPRFIGRIPLPLWIRIASRMRIIQRILRSMFYNVVPLDDGRIFVTFNRQVGLIDQGIYRPVENLFRPCRVLRRAVARNATGDLFFGEYLNNPERGPMRVYLLRTGCSHLEVVHIFPQGEIRHIHGIYFDPYSNCLWCLTGDHGDEAKIIRTKDNFETLETVGSGDETWRAVSFLFTEDAVVYAMDAEFQTNKVFRLNRATGTRTELGAVNGPVYYSHHCGNDLFFAVTAELSPSQVDRKATLWHLDGDSLKPILSFEKDWFPILFMPGTLHMPDGPGWPDRFTIHGVGLNNADNRCIEVSLRKEVI